MTTSAPRVVLASTSRYRCALLARLGIAFDAVAPAIDEEALKDPSLGPQKMAEALAFAKANSLRAAYPGAIIIGSDQACACAGQLLHKPGTLAAAREQLAFLAGQTHELLTAVCILHGDHTYAFTDITRLMMRPLTPGEIERYVAADEPHDCVGAYKLEQRGIALFASIDSRDHTAITGLPLLAVAETLRRCGCIIP